MDETWYWLPDTALATLDPSVIARYLPESARGSSAGPAGCDNQAQAKAPALAPAPAG